MLKNLLLPLLLLLALPAQADDTLYRAWGDKAGIRAVMDDFVQRLPQHERIGRRFQGVDPEHLASQLTEQLCELAGGPCKYEGPDMKLAHEGMTLRTGDFNALVEVLQAAMAARGIPFAAQNRMLAKLAPMHRDIVTR